MQEIHTPLLRDPQNHYRNISDLLEERLRLAPDHIAFEIPERDAHQEILGWQAVTTEDFAQEVKQFAAALLAGGLAPGDRVAIFAPTSYFWALADLASMYAGGIVVPIYDSSSVEQVKTILEQTQPRIIFTGGKYQQTTAQKALGQLGATTPLISIEDRDAYRAFLEPGQKVTEAELEARRINTGLDDVATIVFTSGTTSRAKGAQITHRNLLGQVLNVAAAYQEVVHEQGSTIIVLPLAHVLARGLQFACLAGGMRVAHLADPKDFMGQVEKLRPTFLVLVPRVLEKIQEKVGEQAQKKRLGWLWNHAQISATSYGRELEEAEASPLARKIFRAGYDRLFYSRIRGILGGKIDWILTGGAPLDSNLSRLFRGMGIPIIEGYGLTETTAPISGNLPHRIRSGSVGLPLPGASIRIAENGEVLVKGIGVFSGYLEPEETARAFDTEGYFRTGDIGTIRDGYLYLQGRLKDDIVTSNGKSISPYTWEQKVLANPLVAHAVVLGEGRKYLTALIVPDTSSPRVQALDPLELEESIAASVAAANQLVARSEQVKKYRLVEIDLADPQLVTPTQKLKRAVLSEVLAAEIESLYT